MAEHTPGPWRYEKPKDYETNERFEFWAADGTGIGECHWEKNAHLIAAAPELLEALEDCRSALDQMMGDSDLPEDDSAEMKAIQKASAAIAKAKGHPADG